MNIEDFRNYCLSFKGVSEEIKWETTLTFMVGPKIFVFSSADSFPSTCSVKVDSEQFEELIEMDNFIQAPYLAKKQWVKIENIELVKDQDLKELVSISYEIIKGKLTKKLQREIDELD